MSYDPTSHHRHLHGCTEVERSTDMFYNILMLDKLQVRDNLVSGIVRMVAQQSKHPSINSMVQHQHCPAVQKAFILGALYAEPDFFTYLTEMDGVCNSAVSEFVANLLPDIVTRVLNGYITLDEFIAECTHQYVRL